MLDMRQIELRTFSPLLHLKLRNLTSLGFDAGFVPTESSVFCGFNMSRSSYLCAWSSDRPFLFFCASGNRL